MSSGQNNKRSKAIASAQRQYPLMPAAAIIKLFKTLLNVPSEVRQTIQRLCPYCFVPPIGDKHISQHTKLHAKANQMVWQDVGAWNHLASKRNESEICSIAAIEQYIQTMTLLTDASAGGWPAQTVPEMIRVIDGLEPAAVEITSDSDSD